MSPNWTPKSRVSTTDAGVVIEVEVGDIQISDLEMTVEADHVCVRGQREDVGCFESRFEVPSGHNLVKATVIFADGVLRIEVPRDDGTSLSKPHAMLIRCADCGKHFDIIVTGKGSKDYRCPGCGRVQSFDLHAFIEGG